MNDACKREASCMAPHAGHEAGRWKKDTFWKHGDDGGEDCALAILNSNRWDNIH